MFSSIGYYFLFSSIVLVHGICLDRVIFESEKISGITFFLIKNTVCVCSGSVLTALLVKTLFVPIGMTDLMPLAALLVFAIISVFSESIIRITAKRSAAEFTVPFLCVLFSLSETGSVSDAVLWSFCAIISYYVFIVVFSIVRKRLEATNPPVFFQDGSLLLISVAVVMLIVFSLTGSWLLPEVAG
jgi:Na+-translocating ferredoxin:NAD+ oxidoreductase RnfA subunit